MATVLIPADGWRGETFRTYAYDRNAARDDRWEVLVGEGLTAGREMTRDGLGAALRSGAYYIRARK